MDESCEDRLTAVEKIRSDLAWRGPNDKAMGHVVLTREQAESILPGPHKFKWHDDGRCFVGELCVGAVSKWSNDGEFLPIVSAARSIPTTHCLATARAAVETEAAALLDAITITAHTGAKALKDALAEIDQLKLDLKDWHEFVEYLSGQSDLEMSKANLLNTRRILWMIARRLGGIIVEREELENYPGDDRAVLAKTECAITGDVRLLAVTTA